MEAWGHTSRSAEISEEAELVKGNEGSDAESDMETRTSSVKSLCTSLRFINGLRSAAPEIRVEAQLVEGNDNWQSDAEYDMVELLCASLRFASGLSGAALSGKQPLQGIPEHPLQAHHFYEQDLHSTDLMQNRIACKIMLLNAKQGKLDSLTADTTAPDMLLNVNQDAAPRDRFRRSPLERQHRQSVKPRSFCQESLDHYLLLSQIDVAYGRQGYYKALAQSITLKRSITKTHDSFEDTGVAHSVSM